MFYLLKVFYLLKCTRLHGCERMSIKQTLPFTEIETVVRFDEDLMRGIAANCIKDCSLGEQCCSHLYNNEHTPNFNFLSCPNFARNSLKHKDHYKLYLKM